MTSTDTQMQQFVVKDELEVQVASSLKLELDDAAPEQAECGNIDVEDYEEKENSNDDKENSNDGDMESCYSDGESKTPLAVPMVADSLQHSVTRSDAKVITESRLKRLKELSQRPEDALSKPQKDEKKRIIRLEKNRRAAAMSRRKKKMYVKGLEEKYQLMARHLAILEMENAHLHAVLNASHHNITIPPPMHGYKMSGLAGQFPSRPSAAGSSADLYSATTSTSQSATTRNTGANSMEPLDSDSGEPLTKRRKLNDGSLGSSSTSLPVCDDMSDDSDLEPLPLNNGQQAAATASTSNDSKKNIVSVGGAANSESRIPPRMPMPVGFMPPNMMMPRMLPFPPHMLHNRRALPPRMLPLSAKGGANTQRSNSVVEIHDDSPQQVQQQNNKQQQLMDDNLPPDISNDYLTMLDDDIIEETVDDYGSVLEFATESDKNNEVIYL